MLAVRTKSERANPKIARWAALHTRQSQNMSRLTVCHFNGHLNERDGSDSEKRFTLGNRSDEESFVDEEEWTSLTFRFASHISEP
jgi:hypothetical protein